MSIIQAAARDTALVPGMEPVDIAARGGNVWGYVIVGLAAILFVGLWLWHRSRPQEL
jgi:hypothetical protein